MLPEFIPYIIKRVSYVDPVTGKSHGWSYEKKYRLYHIPTEKLMRFIVDRAHYVDESLVSSTAIVLETDAEIRTNSSVPTLGLKTLLNV